MFSAIRAIGRQFATGMRDMSGGALTHAAAASSSATRGATGGRDEVSYASLGEKDKGMSLDMMKDSLDYEAYKDEADSRKK